MCRSGRLQAVGRRYRVGRQQIGSGPKVSLADPAKTELCGSATASLNLPQFAHRHPYTSIAAHDDDPTFSRSHRHGSVQLWFLICRFNASPDLHSRAEGLRMCPSNHQLTRIVADETTFFGNIAVIAAKQRRALRLGICTCRSRPTAVRNQDCY